MRQKTSQLSGWIVERYFGMSLFTGFTDFGEIFEKHNCGREGFLDMQIVSRG